MDLVFYIGMWCNGNTSDFDSDIAGSSPAVPANTITTEGDKYGLYKACIDC